MNGGESSSFTYPYAQDSAESMQWRVMLLHRNLLTGVWLHPPVVLNSWCRKFAGEKSSARAWAEASLLMAGLRLPDSFKKHFFLSSNSCCCSISVHKPLTLIIRCVFLGFLTPVVFLFIQLQRMPLCLHHCSPYSVFLTPHLWLS